MASEISKAIQFLCDEKGINQETVLTALETALAAAYRKDFGDKLQNIQVKFDVVTGDMEVWDEKEVVADQDLEAVEADQEILAKRREIAREEHRELTEEETADLVVFNPKTEMMLAQAKEIKKKYKVGDTIRIDLEVAGDFGRMAAQTAKQVIIQKIREAERENIFEEFKQNDKRIVQGTIHRKDRNDNVLVDLGKITGLLLKSDQVYRENYRPGNKMRFFVKSVEMGPRGPQILLSRTSNDMIQTVFEQEIPEITTGEVLIKGISRDPGFRAKVAVFTEDESIDPVGACIGQRGSRITTIIEELGGEKIDVVIWSEEATEYIKNALAPAKISRIELNEEEKTAEAFVEDDQFSLAIGRNGQNVRLATLLTGWQISVQNLDPKDASESKEEGEETPAEETTEEVVEEVAVDVAEEIVEEVATEETPETVEEKEETPEVAEEVETEEVIEETKEEKIEE